MSIDGPSTCRQLYDFINELERDIVQNKDQQKLSKINKIPLSPQLLIRVFDIETWALLDNGSQITLVSENFRNKLRSKIAIPEMPVTNVMVFTAIGSKNTSVKKQILVEFECDGRKYNQICLVIPYLSNDIILGNDWNLSNGTVINYNNQTISIKNRVISSKAVLFKRDVSDKIYISKKDDMTCIYVISVEQKYNNNENNNTVKMNQLDILCDYDVIDDENEIIIGEKTVIDNFFFFNPWSWRMLFTHHGGGMRASTPRV